MTRRLASSGRNLVTGSSNDNLPSSYSIIAAREVIGLVIDAIRKMASRRKSRFWATFCLPNAPAYVVECRSTTIATTAGTSPLATRPRRKSSRAACGTAAGGAAMDATSTSETVKDTNQPFISTLQARPSPSEHTHDIGPRNDKRLVRFEVTHEDCRDFRRDHR